MSFQSKNLSGVKRPFIFLLFGLILFGVIIVWSWPLRSDIGPTWRRITIGRSTPDDVLSILGYPDRIERNSNRQVYIYEDKNADGNFPTRIIIEDNVVKVIDEGVMYRGSDYTFMSELVKQYGNPSLVTWSQYAFFTRIVAYPDKGILALVVGSGSMDAIILKIVYYQPRTQLRLLVDFSSEISLIPPIGFGYSDTDVGPRDPWYPWESTSK